MLNEQEQRIFIRIIMFLAGKIQGERLAQEFRHFLAKESLYEDCEKIAQTLIKSEDRILNSNANLGNLYSNLDELAIELYFYGHTWRMLDLSDTRRLVRKLQAELVRYYLSDAAIVIMLIQCP